MAEGNQIAITYQPDEDRLLLRHRIADKDVRLWITRRMAARWVGAVDKVLDHVQGTQAQPADQRRAVSQFRRESAVQGEDFTKPYRAPEPEEAEPYPADGPLLVTTLNLTGRKDGGIVLTFAGRDGTQVKISVSQRELHAIMHMLGLAVRKAEWNLADPAAPASAGPKRPQRAH